MESYFMKKGANNYIIKIVVLLWDIFYMYFFFDG